MQGDAVEAAMQIRHELDCPPDIAGLGKTLGSQVADSSNGFVEGDPLFVRKHSGWPF